jgi:hypothetical protein
MPKCRECKWWGMEDAEFRERCGGFVADACQRHAPSMGPNDPRQDSSARSWPMTRADDWCGDFEPLPKPPPTCDHRWGRRTSPPYEVLAVECEKCGVEEITFRPR